MSEMLMSPLPCQYWRRVRYSSRTLHLVSAYHAIDPSGDLFDFGMSRNAAFGKQKSYDRVGIALEQFECELDAAIGFLKHWDAVVFRKTIAEAEGWTEDSIFDATDFPK